MCSLQVPCRVSNNSKLKCAQKCAHQNFSKKRTNAHIFWPKGAQKCAHQIISFVTYSMTKTQFTKYVYQDIFKANNWLKTYSFKIIEIYLSIFNGFSSDFRNAHKKISMRHLTFNCAPMCAYAHTIRHSENGSKSARPKNFFPPHKSPKPPKTRQPATISHSVCSLNFCEPPCYCYEGT